MEGTRHEKTIIIITSYVIGFTTAFIAFGINKISNPEMINDNVIEPARLTSMQQHEEASNTDGITNVGFGKDGLFAITPTYERLLSADKNSFSATVANSIQNTPGFYYAIVDAEVSRNGKFVYFCEQNDETAKYCLPYVYSLSDDSLHVVKRGGGTYKSPVDGHTSSWSEDNSLVLNGMVSEDNQTPWIFPAPQEENEDIANSESTSDLPQVQ